MKCCICKLEDGKEFGNNAQPIMEGECCDDCNREKVIPRRLELAEISKVLNKVFSKVKLEID